MSSTATAQGIVGAPTYLTVTDDEGSVGGGPVSPWITVALNSATDGSPCKFNQSLPLTAGAGCALFPVVVPVASSTVAGNPASMLPILSLTEFYQNFPAQPRDASLASFNGLPIDLSNWSNHQIASSSQRSAATMGGGGSFGGVTKDLRDTTPVITNWSHPRGQTLDSLGYANSSCNRSLPPSSTSSLFCYNPASMALFAVPPVPSICFIAADNGVDNNKSTGSMSAGCRIQELPPVGNQSSNVDGRAEIKDRAGFTCTSTEGVEVSSTFGMTANSNGSALSTLSEGRIGDGEAGGSVFHQGRSDVPRGSLAATSASTSSSVKPAQLTNQTAQQQCRRLQDVCKRKTSGVSSTTNNTNQTVLSDVGRKGQSTVGNNVAASAPCRRNATSTSSTAGGSAIPSGGTSGVHVDPKHVGGGGAGAGACTANHECNGSVACHGGGRRSSAYYDGYSNDDEYEDEEEEEESCSEEEEDEEEEGGRTRSSANQKDGKFCECWHCEFFGHSSVSS